jgi:cytochrome c2
MHPQWRLQDVAGKSAPAARQPSNHTVHYETGYVMEGRQPGSAMFVKLCAGCHTIGRGDRVGPDLDGLTLRRSRAWITDFLINPIKMRARQDPIALALAAKFPGVRMPYLQVHESDAADLISYIDAHSKEHQPRIALETLYALTTQDGSHLTRPTSRTGRLPWCSAIRIAPTSARRRSWIGRTPSTASARRVDASRFCSSPSTISATRPKTCRRICAPSIPHYGPDR